MRPSPPRRSARISPATPRRRSRARRPAARWRTWPGSPAARCARAEVMDFLTGAPLKPIGSLFDAPPVAEWNAVTIAAGIVAGRREWESRLDNAVRGGSAGETAAFAATMPAFRAFLKRLFDGLEKIAAQPTWRGRTTALTELYRALIVADDAADAALAALDTLSGLDELGEPPTPERFRARVRDLLADARPAIGAFERNEPAVVSLMAARGVPFDLVIVPGLVEKSFPQPARQDPILLDAEREQLAALLARAGKPGRHPAQGAAPRRGGTALRAGRAVRAPAAGADVPAARCGHRARARAFALPAAHARNALRQSARLPRAGRVHPASAAGSSG